MRIRLAAPNESGYIREDESWRGNSNRMRIDWESHLAVHYPDSAKIYLDDPSPMKKADRELQKGMMIWCDRKYCIKLLSAICPFVSLNLGMDWKENLAGKLLKCTVAQTACV